jgi:hypothetical protein
MKHWGSKDFEAAEDTATATGKLTGLLAATAGVTWLANGLSIGRFVQIFAGVMFVATIVCAAEVAYFNARKTELAKAGNDSQSQTSRPVRAARLPIALVIVAQAVAVAGWHAGHSESKAGSPLPHSEANGYLKVSFPGDWEEVDLLPDAPLEMTHAITVAPKEPSPVKLVVGLSGASGPTLLPPGFRRRLDRVPRRDDPVLLGGRLQAYRYSRLRVIGDEQQLTLFVAPTTAGVATALCGVNGVVPDLMDRCERVAQTLELKRGKGFPLGPNPTYAAALNVTIGDLGVARKRAHHDLQGTSDAEGQATAANKLVGALDEARKQMSERKVSPTDRRLHKALLVALEKLRVAYRRIASTAEDGDASQADLNAVVDAARAGERRLRAAVGAFAANGYRIN